MRVAAAKFRRGGAGAMSRRNGAGAGGRDRVAPLISEPPAEAAAVAAGAKGGGWA